MPWAFPPRPAALLAAAGAIATAMAVLAAALTAPAHAGPEVGDVPAPGRRTRDRRVPASVDAVRRRQPGPRVRHRTRTGGACRPAGQGDVRGPDRAHVVGVHRARRRAAHHLQRARLGHGAARPGGRRRGGGRSHGRRQLPLRSDRRPGVPRSRRAVRRRRRPSPGAPRARPGRSWRGPRSLVRDQHGGAGRRRAVAGGGRPVVTTGRRGRTASGAIGAGCRHPWWSLARTGRAPGRRMDRGRARPGEDGQARRSRGQPARRWRGRPARASPVWSRWRPVPACSPRSPSTG